MYITYTYIYIYICISGLRLPQPVVYLPITDGPYRSGLEHVRSKLGGAKNDPQMLWSCSVSYLVTSSDIRHHKTIHHCYNKNEPYMYTTIGGYFRS